MKEKKKEKRSKGLGIDKEYQNCINKESKLNQHQLNE